MAYARTVYTVSSEKAALPDPQNRQFEVDFPYIDKGHISILVDGVETTFFTWVNDARIQLDNAPSAGTTVTLTRETSPSARLVDYMTGSTLSEEILDKDSLQGFYLAQEANDIKEVALSRDGANNWDAFDSRMVNVGDPVDDTDAANKQWVLSATATQVAAANAAKDLANQYAGQASSSQSAAAQSATLASQNNSAAAAQAAAATLSRNESEAFRNETESLLNASRIPTSLNGQGGKFLQVASTELAYELVSSVAAPSFFGFSMSADGKEIIMTYGRDDDYDVADYETWTTAENVLFEVRNNNLTVVL